MTVLFLSRVRRPHSKVCFKESTYKVSHSKNAERNTAAFWYCDKTAKHIVEVFHYVESVLFRVVSLKVQN